MGLVKSVLKMGGGGNSALLFSTLFVFLLCVYWGECAGMCMQRAEDNVAQLSFFQCGYGPEPKAWQRVSLPKVPFTAPFICMLKSFQLSSSSLLMHVCIHMCHRGHGGVRRQLCGISSRLTLLHGFWGSHSVGHWVASAVTSEPSCQPLFNKTKLGLHAFNSST